MKSRARLTRPLDVAQHVAEFLLDFGRLPGVAANGIRNELRERA